MIPRNIAAKKLGYKKAIIPRDPLIPIDMLEGIECIIVRHVHDDTKHLS